MENKAGLIMMRIIVICMAVLLACVLLIQQSYVKLRIKQNNKAWKQELIRRGVMSKTKHGGVVFNKIFVVKVRGEE
jgi:hypothetical protein